MDAVSVRDINRDDIDVEWQYVLRTALRLAVVDYRDAYGYALEHLGVEGSYDPDLVAGIEQPGWLDPDNWLRLWKADAVFLLAGRLRDEAEDAGIDMHDSTAMWVMGGAVRGDLPALRFFPGGNLGIAFGDDVPDIPMAVTPVRNAD